MVEDWAEFWLRATRKKGVGKLVDFVKLVRQSSGPSEGNRRLSAEDFVVARNTTDRYVRELMPKDLFEQCTARKEAR
jgi:hypothetical protein